MSRYCTRTCTRTVRCSCTRRKYFRNYNVVLSYFRTSVQYEYSTLGILYAYSTEVLPEVLPYRRRYTYWKQVHVYNCTCRAISSNVVQYTYLFIINIVRRYESTFGSTTLYRCTYGSTTTSGSNSESSNKKLRCTVCSYVPSYYVDIVQLYMCVDRYTKSSLISTRTVRVEQFRTFALPKVPSEQRSCTSGSTCTVRVVYGRFTVRSPARMCSCVDVYLRTFAQRLSYVYSCTRKYFRTTYRFSVVHVHVHVRVRVRVQLYTYTYTYMYKYCSVVHIQNR